MTYPKYLFHIFQFNLSWSQRPGLNRRPRLYERRALPTELLWQMSHCRESNPRPPYYQYGALPAELQRQEKEVGELLYAL